MRNQLFSIRINQIYSTAIRYIRTVIYITLFCPRNSSVINKFLYSLNFLYYSGLSVVWMYRIPGYTPTKFLYGKIDSVLMRLMRDFSSTPFTCQTPIASCSAGRTSAALWLAERSLGACLAPGCVQSVRYSRRGAKSRTFCRFFLGCSTAGQGRERR